MTMQKISRLKIASVLALMISAHSGAAHAQKSEDIKLRCMKDGAEIFSATVADVGKFDSAKHEANLTQTIARPEIGVTIYVYSPGRIVCLKKNE